MKEKYDPKQWKTALHHEKLKSKHMDWLVSFKSFQKDLDEFVKEDALGAQEEYISNTTLFFDANDYKEYVEKKETPKVLGYVTILNDAISLNADLKQFFGKKGIHYKSLPALKIGRLCVDDDCRSRGIGTAMLLWVIKKAITMNEFSACRFITLDAKRNSDKNLDSLHFYKKLGFNILKERNSEQTPMYLDLYYLIVEQKEEQERKRKEMNELFKKKNIVSI